MKIVNADLLAQTHGLIVHGTNASGGFGSGIAGQIRKQFPQVYEKFKEMPHGANSLGKAQFVNITDDLVIANLFTQLNYGKDGKKYASPEAIKKALTIAFAQCYLYELPLLAPKIGCGLGGLDWETEVKPIFELLELVYPYVDVTIFEYDK